METQIPYGRMQTEGPVGEIQPQAQVQQVQPTVMMSSPMQPNKENYNPRVAIVLGIIQIICGGLSIAFAVSSLILTTCLR